LGEQPAVVVRLLVDEAACVVADTQRLRSMAADAGGDDTEMDIANRSEIPSERRRAARGGVRWRLRTIRKVRYRIAADRVREPLDELRNVLGKEPLLVGHADGVVDHQQQIELLDIP